jgi:hypothetical protein
MPRTRKRTSTSRQSRSGRSARKTQRGTRQSRSKPNYSKWIESPEEHEDRNGQSLATRNHDVIRRWAETRRAAPATVGESRGGTDAAVLRLDFPGFSGKRLSKVDWDAWFETFDDRKS